MDFQEIIRKYGVIAAVLFAIYWFFIRKKARKRRKSRRKSNRLRNMARAYAGSKVRRTHRQYAVRRFKAKAMRFKRRLRRR